MIVIILAALFLLFLFAGLPVAFALGVPGLFYLFMKGGSIPIEFLPHTMTSPLFNFVMIALPAFLLSGRMMNSSGVTNRLFDLAIALVGRFRGGLAHANVVASMFFASMSGTAVGDAGGLGQIEMEMMDRAGFKKDFAAGITAASSVLGPLIPPSVGMVVLGATSGISIGRLFLGGILPGLLMASALMVAIAIRAHWGNGKDWPVTKVPVKDIPISIAKAILPMLTPVIIIGGITFGVVTPTEAAIIAIDYAFILGLFYHEITWKNLIATLQDTLVTTGVFMLIIAMAGFFTWVVTMEGLATMIGNFLTPICGQSQLLCLLIVAAVLVVIGCFLDTTAATLLVTPILMPIINNLGIDPVHFGVIMIVSLMTGIITPPFGICLFVMSDVAKLPVSDVTRESVRYLPAMVITLLLIILIPGLALWIPNFCFK